MERVFVSKVIGHDYRLSRTASTVRVEVLDYHAEPLTLTREQLFDLGIEILHEEPESTPKLVTSDYRFSRTASTLRVETLDYHAAPVTLTRRQLREFGLGIVE